jgi:uncharacterized membrane protein
MRTRVAWLVPIALAALEATWLAWLSVRQRWAMFQFDDDLANYDQVIWNTTQGRWFASTTIEHANNWFGDHFSPVIALFVPLYLLRPTPSWLLVGQAVALAAGVLPLFAFARRELGLPAAWLIALAYAAYPGLHHVALFQMHEIALIVPPLMLALLAVELGRRRLFFGAALACLTVKEEAAVVVMSLGLLWLLRRRDARAALGCVALGALWGYVGVGLIVPWVNSGGTGYLYQQRYAHLGRTPLEMAATLLTRPAYVLSILTTPERLRFLAGLFGPLLLLPLIGWEYLLTAGPIFGYLLLSSSPDMWSIERHYQATLVPFLFFGLVLGLRRLRAWIAPPAPAAAVAVAALAAAWLIGPTPAVQETAHTRDLRRLIAAVPPDAPVSASRNVLSFFTRRERVYRFPVLGDAEYVLWDFRELRHPGAFGLDGGAFGRLVESPDYRMVDSAAGAVLFRRGDPRAWDGGPPTRFGSDIELLAYQTRAAEDGALEVALHWRALRRVDAQYTAFVHLLDARGERVGQSDGAPVDGLMPTDTWTPGHVVVDRHVARAGAAPARLQLGLYDPRDGRRLPITARGLPGPGDTVDVPLTLPAPRRPS